MLICLISVKGAPGVTTTALALAIGWPRPVLVAECDPAGGDCHAGVLGVTADTSRNLFGLALAARRGTLLRELPQHLIAWDEHGSRLLLPGLPNPTQAAGLVPLWGPLAETFVRLNWPISGQAGAPMDVLADCGRLGQAWMPWPLLHSADLVVLVLRSSLAAVHLAQRTTRALRCQLPRDLDGGTGPLVALLVGERRPYTVREINRALGSEVLAAMPWDPRAAESIDVGRSSRNHLNGSAYLASARKIAAVLHARAAERASARPAPAQPEGHTL